VEYVLDTGGTWAGTSVFRFKIISPTLHTHLDANATHIKGTHKKPFILDSDLSFMKKKRIFRVT